MLTVNLQKEDNIASNNRHRRELLLLQACLASENDFDHAFMAFDSDRNLDELTWGELRLVPYLFRRLEHSRLKTPRFDIYKGVYTKFWYLHKMEKSPTLPFLLEVLDGIDFLVLKGAALQPLIYSGDPVTRPIDDIDILVSPHERYRALDRLADAGFTPDQSWPTELTMDLKLSIGLSKANHHVDLHWGLYPSAGDTPATNSIFSRQITVDDGNLRFSSPSISDHLVHNLVHGQPNNDVSPIRWALDCALMSKHPALDWSRVCENAQSWGWQKVVNRQLSYLREVGKVDIPDKVFGMLREGNNSIPLTFYQFNRGLKPSLFRGFLSLLVVNPMNLRELSGEFATHHLFHVLKALRIWLRSWRDSSNRLKRLQRLIKSTQNPAS